MGKRICILTSVHSVFDTRIFQKQAITLVQEGYNVTIIAQHDKDEIVDGINIVAVSRQGSRVKRMLLVTNEILWKALKTKADLYHFHDPELLFIGTLLKLMGNKVIYDVHEDYAKSIARRPYLPAILRTPIAKCFLLIERALSNCFDAIVAATDEIKKNFPDQKAVAVRNYPILEQRHGKNLKEKTGNISFIYVGNLSKANGVSETVCAMEHLQLFSNTKLILAGKFNPPEYEKEVQKLKGFEKVCYKGWISFSDVPALLESADCGIVCCLPEPNSISSLPNKMFEYMSAGLPVIASNFPLWDKMIEKTYCGLCVNPEKPLEIAKAMEFIINNPEIKRQMGEKGRSAVENVYNWNIEANELIRVYERVLR